MANDIRHAEDMRMSRFGVVYVGRYSMRLAALFSFLVAAVSLSASQAQAPVFVITPEDS